MKKTILILAFSIFCFQAKSQILLSLLFGDALNSDGLEFGLQGGFNWSGMSGLETTKSNATFNLGFYFDVRLKNQLSLFTGVMLKQNVGAGELTNNDINFLGGTIFNDEGTYNQVTNFFYIPLLLRQKFQNNMFVELGPQIGYRRNAFVQFKSNTDVRKSEVRDFNDQLFNRFELGISGGLGYSFSKGIGMSIMVKYYQGITEAMKDFSGYKNDGFFLMFSVPIGAGKGKKNEPAGSAGK